MLLARYRRARACASERGLDLNSVQVVLHHCQATTRLA